MRNSPASMSAQAIESSIARYQSPPSVLPLLVRLDIALRQAENAEAQAKRLNMGEMWYRAWKRSMDLRAQIALLKSMTGAQ